MGETTLIREDFLMCLYANLAGMAMYSPLLFRMKFRFTNKTLLCTAATGVLFCNLLAPHIMFLPLLWLVCFIEGMCKIQGTFECMSNIQLWMSPTRDFTVFSQCCILSFREHATVGFACDLSDVLLPLGLHAAVHLRRHDDRLAGLYRMYTSFPHVQEISPIRHRLVGGRYFGPCFCWRLRICSITVTGTIGGTVRLSAS